MLRIYFPDILGVLGFWPLSFLWAPYHLCFGFALLEWGSHFFAIQWYPLFTFLNKDILLFPAMSQRECVLFFISEFSLKSSKNKVRNDGLYVDFTLIFIISLSNLCQVLITEPVLYTVCRTSHGRNTVLGSGSSYSLDLPPGYKNLCVASVYIWKVWSHLFSSEFFYSVICLSQVLQDAVNVKEDAVLGCVTQIMKEKSVSEQKDPT